MKTIDIINSFGPMTMAIITFLFALLNTGLLIIVDKWGIIAYYEIHRRRWMPKKCEFCLFFWMALIELISWAWAFRCPTIDIMAVFLIICFAIIAAVISRFFYSR